jgi:tetratricopeptide (TPR) repeat protein
MRAPDQVEQILAKATEAARQGRDRDSRKLARYALSLDPDHPRAVFRWAVEIIDEPEQAMYYLRRAAGLARGDATVEYQVACVLFDLGEIDESLKLAQRAGRHVGDDFPFHAGLVNLAGRHADAKGDAVGAERALLLAFEMEPEMPWHGLTLAKFLAEQGRSPDALRVTREALQRAPDDPGLLRLEGRLTAAGPSAACAP